MKKLTLILASAIAMTAFATTTTEEPKSASVPAIDKANFDESVNRKDDFYQWATGGKAKFREHILGCKTILWNGPVGVFEINKFSTGSRAVAEAIAEATDKGAYSLIGGGDSVACINKFGLADRVSYVSTGGGALLEYMEGKELPGVAAIRK